MIEKQPFDDLRPNNLELDFLIDNLKTYSKSIINSNREISYFEMISSILNNKDKTNYFISFLNKFKIENKKITLLLLLTPIKPSAPITFSLLKILINYRKFRD